LYAAVPAEDPRLLPFWLPLAFASVLFLGAFAVVGCLELPTRFKETAGWLVLFLLCCLAGYSGYTRLSTSWFAFVEIALCAIYAISGLVGATLTLRRRVA